MLSALIANAQEALATLGDMPVWVEFSVDGYDDTHYYAAPASDAPQVDVRAMESRMTYWGAEVDCSKTFLLDVSNSTAIKII